VTEVGAVRPCRNRGDELVERAPALILHILLPGRRQLPRQVAHRGDDVHLVGEVEVPDQHGDLLGGGGGEQLVGDQARAGPGTHLRDHRRPGPRMFGIDPAWSSITSPG